MEWLSSTDRFTILKALVQAGFNRIGIASSFLHCDLDENKPSNITWVYN